MAPAGPELRFFEDRERLIDNVRALIAAGARQIRVEPAAAAADLIAALGIERGSRLRFVTTGAATSPPLPGLKRVAPDAAVDAVVVASSDAESAAAALMTCQELKHGIVIAPVTDAHSSRRCLFLISIPKAGTHLLYRLAEVFGYEPGIICPANPLPQHWYCIEYSNSHTSARDFFVDTVRRSPFGNKDHPFMRSPAIFIYRDPRDILVSEANWYHRTDASPFHGYLDHLSFRERLLLLLDDPWLLGSIRDRVSGFVPWLDVPNVIPISFEELVGAAGGGDDLVQRQLVWSLQLKLQVAGSPQAFAATLFDRASPTFNEGRIGSWREHFDAEVAQRFARLPQDFMQRFGYGESDDVRDVLPAHRERRRHRALTIDRESFAEVPYLVEADVNGFNIVSFRRLYFAVPIALGSVDLTSLSESQLRDLPHDAEPGALHKKLLPPGAPAQMVASEQLETPMPADILSPRVQSLEERLAERDGRLRGLEATLQEIRQRLRSLEGTLEERDQRIQALEDAAEERELRASALARTLSSRDLRQRSLDERLQSAESLVDELKDTLDRHAGSLQLLKRDVESNTQRVGNIGQTIEERTHRLVTVEGILGGHDERLHSLGDAVEASGRAAAEMKDTVDRQTGLVAALAHEIGQGKSRLEQMEQTAEERSARLASVEHAIEERHARLASLERVVDERHTRLAAAEETLARREQKIAALDGAQRTYDERLQRLERAVDGAQATQDERLRQLERLRETVDAGSERLVSIEGLLDERNVRLAAIEVTIAERDRRLTDLEFASSVAAANLSDVNADLAKLAVVETAVGDLRVGMQRGLHAVAILQGSLQGIEENLMHFRLDRLEAEQPPVPPATGVAAHGGAA